MAAEYYLSQIERLLGDQDTQSSAEKGKSTGYVATMYLPKQEALAVNYLPQVSVDSYTEKVSFNLKDHMTVNS